MGEITDIAVLEAAAQARRNREPATMVTVVTTKGSTPRKPGSRMLVFEDGRLVGTIGGGAVEHTARQRAHEVYASEDAVTIPYELEADLNMGCGGHMTLFFEPILVQPTLIVFGCGHVGSAVLRLAAGLGFDLFAVDELPQNTLPEGLPAVQRVINSYDTAELGDLPFGDDCYIVIVTRGHDYDQQLLGFCAKKQFRYAGVIGSQRKAAKQREALLSAGVAAATLDRVHCPIGLDIGAQTPEEIAVAICAQLIGVRRGGARFSKP